MILSTLRRQADGMPTAHPRIDNEIYNFVLIGE